MLIFVWTFSLRLLVLRWWLFRPICLRVHKSYNMDTMDPEIMNEVSPVDHAYLCMDTSRVISPRIVLFFSFASSVPVTCVSDERHDGTCHASSICDSPNRPYMLQVRLACEYQATQPTATSRTAICSSELCTSLSAMDLHHQSDYQGATVTPASNYARDMQVQHMSSFSCSSFANDSLQTLISLHVGIQQSDPLSYDDLDDCAISVGIVAVCFGWMND